MKISGVLIGSENPAQLQAYYTKIFVKPTGDDDKYFGWQFGDGSITFGPHDQVKGKNREPGRVIVNFETADVKGEFAKLKAAGASVVKEPYDPGEDSGMLIGTFSDPDGNYFQLASPMDEATMENTRNQATARR